MAGQLIKRGKDTWLCRVYLGRDQATGKRSYLNKTIHGTKRDAQRWLTDALRRRDLGEAPSESETLCSEFFEKWLRSSVTPRVRPATLYAYRKLVERFLLPAIGGRRLCDVRPSDLQSIYSSLQERGYAGRTVQLLHRVASNAFRQAVKWGMLRQSPTAHTDPPRKERRELRSLTAAEVRRLVESAKDEQARLLLELAVISGARPGEYLALKWSDLDLEAGTVTIQRQLSRRLGGEEKLFSEPKTAHGSRSVPLPASTIARLTSHRRRQAESRLEAGAAWSRLDLIFCDGRGRPYGFERARVAFRRAAQLADLPPETRLYDLRHACASILMAAGINPKVVSERLGHSSIGITLEVYSHVLPGMQRQAADRLEEAIFDPSAHAAHTNAKQ